MVDWGPLAIPRAPYIENVFYPFAVENTWIVGERVGEFILWLKQLNLVTLPKVHILGFSLGSHVAGKAGDVVREKSGKRVARITGKFTHEPHPGNFRKLGFVLKRRLVKL